MKRQALFVVIVMLVFICFGLAVWTKNLIFIYLIFGFFLLISILFLPIYLNRFRKEYHRQEKLNQEKVIEQINEENYNPVAYDVQQVKNVVDVWKLSSKADIIKGILFVSFFLSCIVGFLVCISLGYMPWGYACFGLGAAEIITAFICVKWKERKSLRCKKSRTYTKAIAMVVGCTISSQTTTGTRRHTHIGNTTYKVFLDDLKVAYSKESYEYGDKVDIKIDIKNPKRVHIIGKHIDDLEIQEEY